MTPNAAILMIVPLMIWSARTLMDSHACNAETTTPDSRATISPITSARLAPNKPRSTDPIEGASSTPAYQPTKAAVIMIPSMPMLTTPARSHITPHNAAKAIGVAAWRIPGAMLGSTAMR